MVHEPSGACIVSEGVGAGSTSKCLLCFFINCISVLRLSCISPAEHASSLKVRALSLRSYSLHFTTLAVFYSLVQFVLFQVHVAVPKITLEIVLSIVGHMSNSGPTRPVELGLPKKLIHCSMIIDQ